MSPNETPVPEWMKKKQEENDLAESREQARLHRIAAGQLFVEMNAPKFWMNLLEKLKIAVDALPILKMAGSYTAIGHDSVRINVSSPGLFANFTYTDLFRDDNGIRCSTVDAGVYHLLFCVIGD